MSEQPDTSATSASPASEDTERDATREWLERKATEQWLREKQAGPLDRLGSLGRRLIERSRDVPRGLMRAASFAPTIAQQSTVGLGYGEPLPAGRAMAVWKGEEKPLPAGPLLGMPGLEQSGYGRFVGQVATDPTAWLTLGASALGGLLGRGGEAAEAASPVSVYRRGEYMPEPAQPQLPAPPPRQLRPPAVEVSPAGEARTSTAFRSDPYAKPPQPMPPERGIPYTPGARVTPAGQAEVPQPTAYKPPVKRYVERTAEGAVPRPALEPGPPMPERLPPERGLPAPPAGVPVRSSGQAEVPYSPAYEPPVRRAVSPGPAGNVIRGFETTAEPKGRSLKQIREELALARPKQRGPKPPTVDPSGYVTRPQLEYRPAGAEPPKPVKPTEVTSSEGSVRSPDIQPAGTAAPDAASPSPPTSPSTGAAAAPPPPSPDKFAAYKAEFDRQSKMVNVERSHKAALEKSGLTHEELRAAGYRAGLQPRVTPQVPPRGAPPTSPTTTQSSGAVAETLAGLERRVHGPLEGFNDAQELRAALEKAAKKAGAEHEELIAKLRGELPTQAELEAAPLEARLARQSAYDTRVAMGQQRRGASAAASKGRGLAESQSKAAPGVRVVTKDGPGVVTGRTAYRAGLKESAQTRRGQGGSADIRDMQGGGVPRSVQVRLDQTGDTKTYVANRVLRVDHEHTYPGSIQSHVEDLTARREERNLVRQHAKAAVAADPLGSDPRLRGMMRDLEAMARDAGVRAGNISPAMETMLRNRYNATLQRVEEKLGELGIGEADDVQSNTLDRLHALGKELGLLGGGEEVTPF